MKNLAEYTALPENETEFAVAYYYEHRKEKKRYGK